MVVVEDPACRFKMTHNRILQGKFSCWLCLVQRNHARHKSTPQPRLSALTSMRGATFFYFGGSSRVTASEAWSVPWTATSWWDPGVL